MAFNARLLGSSQSNVVQRRGAAGLGVLLVAISGSSAPLVLRLQRVRVLLGSHAERGPLAGGGVEDAENPQNKILCIHVEIWCRRCTIWCPALT